MGMEIFTASGTFSPANWGLKAGDMVQLILVGGGGGGGCSVTDGQGGNAGHGAGWVDVGACGGSGAGYGAGGGGCNAYGGNGGTVKMLSVKLTSAANIPVTIGTAGTGGIGVNAGTSGGTTSFGSYASAPGGGGGSPSHLQFGCGGGGGYIIGSPIYGGLPLAIGIHPEDSFTVRPPDRNAGWSSFGNNTNDMANRIDKLLALAACSNAPGGLGSIYNIAEAQSVGVGTGLCIVTW